MSAVFLCLFATPIITNGVARPFIDNVIANLINACIRAVVPLSRIARD
jgi:hypothetical protein